MNNGFSEGNLYKLRRNNDITTTIIGQNPVVLEETRIRQEPIYVKK